MKKLVMVFLYLWCIPSSFAMTAKWNGFFSLVGAEVIGGNVNDENYNGRYCPCFIADYHEGGVYEKDDFSLELESRIGGQANLELSNDFHFITQLVARESDLNLSWAYLSWDFQPHWTLQLGRKRIPLYSKSEIQDVGFAYDWIRPPQTLYGWEAVGYNGVNLRYVNQWHQWDLTTNIFLGQDKEYNSGYSDIYSPIEQDVQWKNIRGIEVSANYQAYTLRWVYMESDNSITNKPVNNEFLPTIDQKIMGFAIDADYESWFILGEININIRDNTANNYKIKAPAVMLSVGKRWQDWTLLASSSRYWETSSDNAKYAAERFINSSLTLGYGLTASSSIKIQLDRLSDQSHFDFVGSTNVLSIAYDCIF